MRCNTARKLIYRHLDEDLNPELRATFADHLKECPDCKREVEQTRTVELALVGQVTEEAVRPDFVASVMAQVRAVEVWKEDKPSVWQEVLRIGRERRIARPALVGVLALIVLLGLWPHLSRTPNADAILARALASYDRVQDYVMTVRQEVSIWKNGKQESEVSEGTHYYRRPGWLKADGPPWTRGAMVWCNDLVRYYFPEYKVLIERVRYPAEHPPAILTGAGESMDILRRGSREIDAEFLREDKVLGRPCDVIRARYRNRQIDGWSVDSWIDRNSGLVLKQAVKTNGRTYRLWTAIKLVIDHGLPDSVFALKTPRDTRVVRGDIRPNIAIDPDWSRVSAESLDKAPDALEITSTKIRQRMDVDWPLLCPTHMPAGHRYLGTDMRGGYAVEVDGLRTAFLNVTTGTTVIVDQCSAKHAPQKGEAGEHFRAGPLQCILTKHTKPFPYQVVTWQQDGAYLTLTDTGMLPEAELTRVIRGMRPLKLILEERRAGRAIMKFELRLRTSHSLNATARQRIVKVLSQRATELGAKEIEVDHVARNGSQFVVRCRYAGEATRLERVLTDPGRLRLVPIPKGFAVQHDREQHFSFLRDGKPVTPANIMASQKPIVTEADVKTPVELNVWSDGSQYEVLARLIERGRRAFAEYTRKHVGEMIGIYWNERMVSAPVVRAPIEGGNLWVASSPSREEPEDIAICLNSGPLPVKLAVQR